MVTVEIREARYDEPEVRALITLALGDLSGRYGGTGDDTATIDRSTATANLTFNEASLTSYTTLVGDGTKLVNVENIDLTGGSGNDRFTTGAVRVSEGFDRMFIQAGGWTARPPFAIGRLYWRRRR